MCVRVTIIADLSGMTWGSQRWDPSD